MTVFLTVEQVIDLHHQEKECALIDYGKLASAVGQPAQTWEGRPHYPTLIEQAAALLFCICKAHAFEDANKRTAWVACTTFLEINGVDLVDIPQADVVATMKQVADAGWTIREISDWLIERI